MRSLCQPGPLNVLPPGVVYGDDGDNREDHVDRKQARAFEGFVTKSGDALLRMATLLTADPDAAEDVYQETLHRLAMRWSRVDNPGRSAGG
jgi:DNA-directed RNA polymerase specialized sigma24 family protein